MSRAVQRVIARVCGAILGITAALFGIGAAHADGPVFSGDTAYFALGGWNCSIAGNGVVGCDLNVPAASMNVLYAGTQVSVPNVPAIIIDSTAMPARPQWNSNGSHTLPGGNPPLPRIVAVGDHDPRYSITHAGATCQITFKEVAVCTSLGHGFSQWGPVPNGY